MTVLQSLYLYTEKSFCPTNFGPFGEIGAKFSLQLSWTQFAKIFKKVIAENQCEKHKNSSLVVTIANHENRLNIFCRLDVRLICCFFIEQYFFQWLNYFKQMKSFLSNINVSKWNTQLWQHFFVAITLNGYIGL